MRRVLARLLVTVSVLWLGISFPSNAALGGPLGSAQDRVVHTTWAPGTVDADGVLRLRGDVQIIGASWSRGHRLSAATVVEARIRHSDGSWSTWTRIEPGDVSPDPETAEGHATVPAAEPVWFGAGTSVEVRVNGDLPAGFAITTAYSAPRARDAQLTRASGAGEGARRMVTPRTGIATTTLPIQPVPPAYFTRADWGADQTQQDGECPSPSETVKVVFVHHTAGTNEYSESDVPALLRGVHAYHTSHGWCDIAYNALIDRFGRVWEGRAGGMDQPVRSGATGGFNKDSWAISLVGNYSTTPLPTPAYVALRDLAGWKLLQNRRDPLATETLTQAEGGRALGALWTDGQSVPFNVISGHRDATSTECPGNLAYPLLSALRRDVNTAMTASPRGNLERVSTGFRSIRVSGWAFDPETTDPWYVWVAVDGPGQIAPAGRERPDVGAAYPTIGDHHGFDVTVDATPGLHTVCVSGMNWGAGHATSLGCRQLAVSTDPIGQLDSVRVSQQGFTVTGWALDPETEASTYVWIDVSGTGVLGAADKPRPDVAAALGVGSNHGYAVPITRPRGGYGVCAYAMNVGLGSDRLLGCRWVNVA